jgi:hypothetical protein
MVVVDLAVCQKSLADRKVNAVERICAGDRLNLRDCFSGSARSIQPVDAWKNDLPNDLSCSLPSIQLAPAGIVAPGATSRVRS